MKKFLGLEFGSTRIKAVLIGPDHAPLAQGDYTWENRLENGVWTYPESEIWAGLQAAYAALAAWLGARAAGGRVLLRIEDIDAPRVVKDADRWIMDDLTWLGLDWDGDAVYQSQRLDTYEEALRRLREQGLVYPCFCSRADIRAASAPNEGDGFLIYPGTCRRLPAAERESRVARGNRHSWRLAVPDAYADPDPDTSVMSEHADSDISRVDRAACDAPTEGLPRVVCFDDRVFGPQRFDLPRQLGDVVVRRSDGLFAYQLAVSVDDMAMGVTQIVRGRDLLRSTAIQLYVRRCLGATDTPEFAHLPLIDAADGRRMAKRLNSLDLGAMRERGDDPRAVVGYCAWLLRLVGEPRPMTPQELLPLFSWDAVAADTADRVADGGSLFR